MKEPSTVTPDHVEKLKTHDNDAWAFIVKRYSSKIMRHAKDRGFSELEAEDITQKVFMAASRAIERIEITETTGTFKGWLYGIFDNVAKDHRRKTSQAEKAQGGTSVVDESWVDRDPDRSSTKSNSKIARFWDAASKKFSETTLEMFKAVVILDQPISVVANRFEKTPTAVRIAKSRVLQFAREFGNRT